MKEGSGLWGGGGYERAGVIRECAMKTFIIRECIMKTSSTKRDIGDIGSPNVSHSTRKVLREYPGRGVNSADDRSEFVRNSTNL